MKQNVLKGLFGKIFRYGLYNADFIIAQTEGQKLKLKSNRINRKYQIKVIKNIYNIENLAYIKEKETILWIGRAIDYKRPDLFIKLAKRFPMLSFLMVCNKEVSYTYWERISNAASKIPNLKFIEFVPFHKIEQYFQEAKIFVNTSILEGFPNTFVQAFKNFTPVISLNVNPDRILTKYKIGFYCDNDFSKMEEYLKLLLSDDTLYENYSKNAYEYVKNHHDINKVIKVWIQLIKSI